MITAIILSLAVLTATLVVGVFVVALVEINRIDDIASDTSRETVEANLGPSVRPAVSAGCTRGDSAALRLAAPAAVSPQP